MYADKEWTLKFALVAMEKALEAKVYDKNHTEKDVAVRVFDLAEAMVTEAKERGIL